jgi:glucose-1-phosphate thymidylyltransferase
MKGVILAGGTGSRLHPLTRITNKHLLPIYDRPMVTYAIEALVSGGVTEILVVTGGTHAGEFFPLLGDGHGHGIGLLSTPTRSVRLGSPTRSGSLSDSPARTGCS